MLLERAAAVFGEPQAKGQPPVDLKALHAKIGQLAIRKPFFGRRAH